MNSLTPRDSHKRHRTTHLPPSSHSQRLSVDRQTSKTNHVHSSGRVSQRRNKLEVGSPNRPRQHNHSIKTTDMNDDYSLGNNSFLENEQYTNNPSYPKDNSHKNKKKSHIFTRDSPGNNAQQFTRKTSVSTRTNVPTITATRTLSSDSRSEETQQKEKPSFWQGLKPNWQVQQENIAKRYNYTYKNWDRKVLLEYLNENVFPKIDAYFKEKLTVQLNEYLNAIEERHKNKDQKNIKADTAKITQKYEKAKNEIFNQRAYAKRVAIYNILPPQPFWSPWIHWSATIYYQRNKRWLLDQVQKREESKRKEDSTVMQRKITERSMQRSQQRELQEITNNQNPAPHRRSLSLSTTKSGGFVVDNRSITNNERLPENKITSLHSSNTKTLDDSSIVSNDIYNRAKQVQQATSPIRRSDDALFRNIDNINAVLQQHNDPVSIESLIQEQEILYRHLWTLTRQRQAIAQKLIYWKSNAYNSLTPPTVVEQKIAQLEEKRKVKLTEITALDNALSLIEKQISEYETVNNVAFV